MRVFAIGDLHLPGGQEKPMDVFGERWAGHGRRIAERWRELVSEEDVVLVPGDISWAMKLDEARDDLAYLGALPGRAVIIRGNHDYWWQAIGKVRRALPPNVAALQNDHVPLGGPWAVCGTRGWVLPGTEGFTEEDRRIYEREVQRLALSLESAAKAGLRPVIAMLHFPPAHRDGAPTEFTRLLEEYGVRLCVYGHLHGEAARGALRGTHRGVHYELVACDAIGFAPKLVAELAPGGEPQFTLLAVGAGKAAPAEERRRL